MTKKQYILPVSEITILQGRGIMDSGLASISGHGGYGAAPALPHKSSGAVSAF